MNKLFESTRPSTDLVETRADCLIFRVRVRAKIAAIGRAGLMQSGAFQASDACGDSGRGSGGVAIVGSGHATDGVILAGFSIVAALLL